MADAVEGPVVDEDAPAKEYQLDRDAVAAALAEIDQRQAHHPTCALCGQRAVRLDKHGLCSKNTKPHEDWRKEARADAKAGRR